MKYLSPLEMLYKWEQEKPNEIYLSHNLLMVNWHNWTWKEFGIEVRKMAAYLKLLESSKQTVRLGCFLKIVHIG